MSQHGSRIGEFGLAARVESEAVLTEPDAINPQALRAPTVADEGAAIAWQLNGPLTALLLYMGEIKQLSRVPSRDAQDRAYLQKIVDHALQQTERVCALVKQIEAAQQRAPAVDGTCEIAECAASPERNRQARVAFVAKAGQRPLTKRECEVLQFISEGYSNKQGALRMRISPRTFESHRAEAMRKLGARNTAELVRAALLLQPGERPD
jgi:DNA-binding CsgD family transcriptional regulator